ncbi:MAG: hypothetical protein ACI4O0_07895 [Candidatus Limivicinus sp.]
MTELERAIAFNQEIRSALLTVYNELNQGQQQKLLKNEQVKALFDRYGVLTE